MFARDVQGPRFNPQQHTHIQYSFLKSELKSQCVLSWVLIKFRHERQVKYTNSFVLLRETMILWEETNISLNISLKDKI